MSERLTEWIDDGEEKRAVPKMDLRRNGYQRCCNKLGEYEDLEEQGLLLKLPVAVGQGIYEIIEDDIPEPHLYIAEYTVEDVSVKGVKYCENWYGIEDFSNMFFTREEAEKRLRELEGKR